MSAITLSIQNSSTFFNQLYYKLKDCDRRMVINYGGAGSGKSYAQAQLELRKLLDTSKKEKILVVRKVASTLRDSVIPLLIDELIEKYKVGHLLEFSKTGRQLRNKVDGSVMIFRGIDDPEKIKSIHGITRIWVEEASELTEDDFNQLNLRLRGVENPQISLTFNPIHEQHWLKKRFFDRRDKNVQTFKTTYKHNQFIDDAYKKQLVSYRKLDMNYYRIYCLGQWGKTSVRSPFVFAFDEDKHVQPLHMYTGSPLYLSFDFNINPITCLLAQHDDDNILILKEFRLTDSNIHHLCEVIIDYLKQHFVTDPYIHITGDATGQASNAMLRDNTNFYKIICKYFGIPLHSNRLRVPSVNPPIKNSRVLVNHIFQYKNIKVNTDCFYLIEDLKYVEADHEGKIDKAKDARRTHLLDCIRYYLNAFWSEEID